MAASRDHLRFLSMVLLTFQGTALSLTLRYSRTNGKTPYLPSVAVIFTELAKLIICAAAQFSICIRVATPCMEPLRSRLWRQCHDILQGSRPLVVPSALFVFQQVLVIIAASHLDAVAFEIFSQSFKIVPTAIFTVLLLGQRLSPLQWSSLPLLVTGVVLMTLHRSKGSNPALDRSWATGILASSLGGLSSAYAGVYFERYVKGVDGASLLVRNIQLGLYGVPMSIAYACFQDHRKIQSLGLLQGFTTTAWGVVSLQVFGGLAVSMVVKYADNILKNFANAVSVILTALLAVPIFGLWPSCNFLFGVATVLLAMLLYGAAPSGRPAHPAGTRGLRFFRTVASGWRAAVCRPKCLHGPRDHSRVHEI